MKKAHLKSSEYPLIEGQSLTTACKKCLRVGASEGRYVYAVSEKGLATA